MPWCNRCRFWSIYGDEVGRNWSIHGDEVGRNSDTMIVALADGCPLLKRFSLTNCNLITTDAILALITKCVNIDYYWVCCKNVCIPPRFFRRFQRYN